MSKKEFKSTQVKFLETEENGLPSNARLEIGPIVVEPLAEPKPTEQQTEVLQNYIAVKEAEISDYREQKKQLEVLTKKISSELRASIQKNRELLEELDVVKNREKSLRAEFRDSKEKHKNEMQLLKNDFEEKIKSAGELESRMADFERNREEWKEKIKRDLNRIKLKERELENKYELLKRDTTALVDSKDKHILELSTKKDALELEMESFEEKLRTYNTILGSMDSKKRRLIETLKVAKELLESIDQVETNPQTARKP